MPQPRVPIGCLHISAKAKRYVNRALDADRLSYGPFTRRYEELFARKHGCRFGIASASGTFSLQSALAALKEVGRWSDNMEVIVPATTFIATSNIVIYNRLRPVFVDVDPVYYEITPEKVRERLTRRTRGMIPVHLFGQPADMQGLMALARKHRLRVIEDSSETMLAAQNGRSVGSFGDIGCFSTYVAHLLTTGVGGVSTTNDPELEVILRSLINHGRDSAYLSIDDDDKASPARLRRIIRKRFSFVRFGHSARLTELESAIGLAQLENELAASIRIRRRNAAYLTGLLKPFEDHLQLPQIRPGTTHSFMVYPIVLRSRKKEALVAALERKGIETRDLMPLIGQPVYRKEFALRPKDFPVSQWLAENGFYIGCHQGLTREHLDYTAESIADHFKKSR